MALQLISTINPELNTEAAELDSLIHRVAAQDSTALNDLYQKTSSSIYGFALSILKNTHDAEDVLHDSYLSIYSAAGSYRTSGKPMAWILTIAKNHCLQKLRDHKRSADIPQEDWEPYLQSREGISTEDKLVLHGCMSRLSDQERQIVVLHAVAGFKHRETAKMLHLPLSTVLSKYNRAIKKLNTYLSQGGQI